MTSRMPNLKFAVGCLVVLGVAAVAGAQATPKFAQIPVDARFKLPANADKAAAKQWNKDMKRWTRQADRMLTGAGTAFDANFFQQWHRQYQFPVLTDPNYLPQIADWRYNFLKDIRKSKNPQAKNAAMTLVLSDMPALFNGNYHPAVRYNAMLLVAGLNTQEADGNAKRPPVANPQALTVMLDGCEKADQHDVVLLAGLLGIYRHVDLDSQLEALTNRNGPIDGAGRNRIATLMNKLLKQEKPAGRSNAAHHWLRRQALEVLAAVPGSAATAAPLALSIIKNKDEATSVRCAAARAISRIAFDQENPGITATEVAADLGTLASVFCKQELDFVEQLRKHKDLKKDLKELASGRGTVGGGGGGGGAGGGMAGGRGGGSGQPAGMSPFGPGGGGGGGGMGGAGGGGGTGIPGAKQGDPNEKLLDVVRRRLQYKLYCTKIGLDRLFALAGGVDPDPKAQRRKRGDAVQDAPMPADAKKIDKIRAAVTALMDELEKGRDSGLKRSKPNEEKEIVTLETLVKSLQQKRALLRNELPQKAAAPAGPKLPGQPKQVTS